MTVAAASDRRRIHLPASSRRSELTWANTVVHLPVLILTGVYIWYFSRLSVAAFDGYSDPGYDLGIFDQGIWLLAHFKAPFVTVMGRDLFGDHTDFVFILMVPMYWIWESAKTLLVTQSVLIGLTAIPIYLFSLKVVRSALVATLVAGAYLCNAALQWGNLEQAHPEMFEVFFIALAIWAAQTRRYKTLWVSVAICLLTKETAGFLVIPLGVWVGLRRNHRVGLAIVLVSAVWTAICFELIIPALLGVSSLYSNRIPFGGIAGSLKELVIHPATFFRYLWSGNRPFYLWQLTITTGVVWVISPEVALIAVGAFASNVISNFPYMYEIHYHYTLPLIPVLVMGSAWAIGRLRGLTAQRLAALVVAVCAVVTCHMWGLGPFSRDTYPHLNPRSAQVAQINRIRDQIPPNADISAYYGFISQVDHRVHAYQWPTPFKAVYWHLYTQEGQRLSFSGQVNYLFLPTQLQPSDQQVLDSIRSQFVIIDSNFSATLWERRSLKTG